MDKVSFLEYLLRHFIKSTRDHSRWNFYLERLQKCKRNSVSARVRESMAGSYIAAFCNNSITILPYTKSKLAFKKFSFSCLLLNNIKIAAYLDDCEALHHRETVECH